MGNGRSRSKTRVATAPEPRAAAGARLPLGLAYAAVAALLALLPVVFDPRVTGSFRAPKLFFAEILGLASLSALAAAGRLDLGRLVRAEATRAAAPLLGVALALAPFAAHPEHSRPAWISAAIGVGCLVGWSVGFSPERLRALLRWSLPAAGATGFLGLAQALDWYQPFGVATEGVAGAERLAIIGLAGNPGSLAASLVLPALVAQAELARRRGALALFAAAGCAAGIVATQTLAALGALLAGSLVLWGTRAPARRKLLLSAFVVGVLGVATLAIAPARERFLAKGREVAAGEWNAALTGRLDGWRAALEIFREHPGSGRGLGSFRAEFSDAKARLLDRGVEFFAGHQYPVFANAHSEPLEVAAELGLLGLAALAWGLWRLARALGRATGPLAATEATEVGLARGGALALLLFALTGFPFRVALVAYPGLVFLAWIFAGAAGEVSAAPAPRVRLARAGALALAFALAAAALLRLDAARDRLEAQNLLRSVELRTQQLAATGTADPRRISAHLAALEDAQRADPGNVAIRIARGNQYLLLDSLEAAIETYREAQRFERRPETHLNLGQALARAGCDAEAETEWAWAVRLDPALGRQVPRRWPGSEPGSRVFATGFECGLTSWRQVREEAEP